MLVALLSTTCLALIVLSIIQQRKLRALRQGEETFRTLIENSPDLIFRYDRQGRCLYVNPAVARVFGKSVEEMVGKSPADSPILYSAQNREFVDGIRQVFETGETRQIEIVFAAQEGQPHNYIALLIPERDAEGQVNTVLAHSRDITAVHDAERLVSSFVAQLPGFVFKFRMSADGDMCYPYASPRIEEFFGLRPEDVADSAAPLHAMTHPNDAPRVLRAILKSARTLSRSQVEYRLLRPGYPERWMEVIANPEQEIDGGVLWYGFFLDITERKRLQDELATSHNFLDRIIDAVADPIFVKDRQHRWIHLNEASCCLFGGTREELIGKSDFDFFPEHEASSFWEGDEVVFTSGEEFASEDQITNKQGEKRYIFTRKTAFIDPHGRPILVGVISDITERKRLENELAESQNFLDRIINATIDPIFVKDRQHRWILVNDAFCQLLGSTPEKLIGKSDFEFLPEDEARLLWEGDELVFTKRKELAREEEITTKGGEKRCIFTRKRLFYDVHGKPNLTAVMCDISERKRMELQLAARERELRSLMNNIPANIIRFTPDAHTIYANSSVERLVGLPSDDWLGKTPMEVFPDGRYSAFERRVLATAASGGSDEMELVVPIPNGDVEHHLIHFVAEYDEKGTVNSVLIIGTDITERKRAELALSARKRELSTLMENIPDNVVRFTPDTRYLYLNPETERSIGKRYEYL
jgi:PAS domain S-box-containing protein